MEAVIDPQIEEGFSASQRLNRETKPKARLITRWLGHADARQVSDLPERPFRIYRSMTVKEFWVGDPEKENRSVPASQRLAAHRRGTAITTVASLRVEMRSSQRLAAHRRGTAITIVASLRVEMRSSQRLAAHRRGTAIRPGAIRQSRLCLAKEIHNGSSRAGMLSCLVSFPDGCEFDLP